MPLYITQPLHLYRAILRETTYLFDQNARTWTDQYVRACFRKHTTRIRDDKGLRVVPYDASKFASKIERHRLKRGREFLLFLQRANQGYQRQLRNLLQLVYGRKGRVKRALTAPLIQPRLQAATSSSESSESLPASQPTSDSPQPKFTKKWKPSSELLTVLSTQSQLSSHLNIKRQIKLKPTIEEMNKWGRPMPLSRIKNATKKWYAHMAGAVMPPIPEADWERLKAIALRKLEFEHIPRRPMAKSTVESKQAVEAERLAHTLVSGVGYVSAQTRSVGRPHKMTPRYLSRVYAKHILNHSPVVEPNPNGKGLISKWDNGQRYVVAVAKPRDITQAEALFG